MRRSSYAADSCGARCSLATGVVELAGFVAAQFEKSPASPIAVNRIRVLTGTSLRRVPGERVKVA